MADLSRYAPSRAITLSDSLRLRPLPKPPKGLEEADYYNGYPCPFGHTIRDAKKHWCYHCAIKIQSNNCGLDINYIDPRYRDRLMQIWNEIEIGELDGCWHLRSQDLSSNRLPRTNLPSYRSLSAGRVADNVPYARAIYMSCWGDAGSLRVTHRCDDPLCLNPLHLVTSLNRSCPPRHFVYFELEYKANKLLMVAKHLNEGGRLEDFHINQYKFHVNDARTTNVYEKLHAGDLQV